MTTAIFAFTIVNTFTILFVISKLKELTNSQSFNHGFTVSNLSSILKYLAVMGDQITENHRKVGTFKTTVLTDMSAYHREVCALLDNVKDEDYKNSDHLRKIIEEVSSQTNLKLGQTQMQISEVASHIGNHVSTNFENTINHISVATNNVIEKVNLESEEIKTFVKEMHETSKTNHNRADTKIEAVFQRVNSGLGIPTVKKIPSL